MQKIEEIKTAAQHALWQRGELSFLLHAGQREIHNEILQLSPDVREVVIFISRRWGKSYLGVILAFMKALEKPNSQVFIVAPTIKHANSITIPLIKEITQSAPPKLITHTKSQYKYNFSNGSVLILGGFDSALESFRGLKADAIFLEESGLSNANEYEYILKSVLLPTLAHSRGRILHLTTPSLYIDHPLHLETIPLAKQNNSFFLKTIYDNPLLDAEQIEQIKRDCGGEQSIAWRREFLCEIVRDEKTVVIPEFNKVAHVKNTTLPAYAKYITTIDWGGSRDKTAAQIIYYDYQQDLVVVVADALFDAGTPSNVITSHLKELEIAHVPKGMTHTRYADVNGQLQIDLSNLHSYPVALPTKVDWMANLNNLNLAFSNNRIVIHPRCEHTALACETALFNATRTDFLRTKILGHCDAIASLMYGFRHVDKTSPFPANYFHSPATHHIPQNDSLQRERLKKAFRTF